MTEIRYSHFESPVGRLLLVARGDSLSAIEFPNGRHARGIEPGWTRSDAPFREVARQLDAYFAGRREEFDLPLAPEGTEFQQATWRALREIPFGETRTYSEIARRIGRPRAVRAVGAANGRNPISIVIPCHRVVGADGGLTGFGGGLPVKRYLLELEGAGTLILKT